MVTLRDRPQIQMRDNWLDLLAHELGAGRKIKRIRSHRASWYNHTLIVFFTEGKSRFVRAALVVEVATLPVNEAVILGETLASLAQHQVSQVQSLIKLGKAEGEAIAEVAGFSWAGQEPDGFVSDYPGGSDPWPSEQAWANRGCPPVPLWAWKGAIVNLRSFTPGKLPKTGDWFQLDGQYDDLISACAIEIYDYFRSAEFEEDFEGDSLHWEYHRFNHRGWDFWEDVTRYGDFDDGLDTTEEEADEYVSIADRAAREHGYGSIEHSLAIITREAIFAVLYDALPSEAAREAFGKDFMPLLDDDQFTELAYDRKAYDRGQRNHNPNILGTLQGHWKQHSVDEFRYMFGEALTNYMLKRHPRPKGFGRR